MRLVTLLPKLTSSTICDALPGWRRVVERMYRCGGFGIYYLVERWWANKFYPPHVLDQKLRKRAFRDFALVMSWLLALCCSVIFLGTQYGHSWWSSLLWGVVLPFFIWNTSMGLTVYLQHTHHLVPWFRTEAEAHRYGGQEELTIHVRYPRWYGILSHEIMEHPAHHINPLIPFYRLHAAQSRLNQLLGRDAIVEYVGLRYIANLLRRCKLYDYERQEWTDFSGRTTGQTHAAFSPEAPGSS